MHSSIVLALVAVLLLAGGGCDVAANPVVPKKPHSLSLESILGNDRLLGNYIQCMLDQGPCSREGLNLKKLLPEAIQTDCLKCTPTQKQNSRKVITFIRTRRPQDWRRLTDKYDPSGMFKARN